jgi:hypothetical protein
LIAAKKYEKMIKFQNIKRFELTAIRNLKDTPFLPLLTKEGKTKTERKISEVLGELFGSYMSLNKIEPDTKEWLKDRDLSIERMGSHDAAGINDDWPTGRGIFIDDE